MMAAEKLPFGAFVFVVGGAENFLTDYPTTGIPAMNRYFRGARTIYNAIGDFYREPLEVLAAEYSWNTRSDGFFKDPAREADLHGVEDWIYKPAAPFEIYGPGKLFDRICARLYGPGAGAAMSAYYREAEPVADRPVAEPAPDRAWYRGRKTRYLPRVWSYATAIPSYWYHLLLDSQTWGPEPTERYRVSMTGFAIDTIELHRRLAHRWQLAVDLNTRGARHVLAALSASPKAGTVEDLRFLTMLFQAWQPILEALRDYHAARAAPDAPEVPALVRAAASKAREAAAISAKLFPEPVDPSMGEIRSLRAYPERLRAAIETWRR
jgi:hypothetical protein